MPDDAVVKELGRELKIAIGKSPICPHCREDGFDDWHHEPSLKDRYGILEGRLRCHGCSKFFSVKRYSDGDTHCTAWTKAAAGARAGGGA